MDVLVLAAIELLQFGCSGLVLAHKLTVAGRSINKHVKGETSFKKKCQKALVSIGNISVILQNIDVQDSPFSSNILIVSVDETLDENLKEFENS